jgi:hypothetical protein
VPGDPGAARATGGGGAALQFAVVLPGLAGVRSDTIARVSGAISGTIRLGKGLK